MTPAHLGPGDLASDSTISVSGLETGDKVSFYQVLQFSPDAVATGGWVPAPGFTGLTDEDIQKILGIGDYAPGKSKADQAGIDENLAARIADMAEQTTAKYPDIKENKGTASKANPEPGLYVALITLGKPGTVYNPVFVGADYTGTNSSSSWDVTIEDSYDPASMAKKAAITLTKTASTADGNPDGVSAGDVVTFTLTTMKKMKLTRSLRLPTRPPRAIRSPVKRAKAISEEKGRQPRRVTERSSTRRAPSFRRPEVRVQCTSIWPVCSF